ncbi:MAG: DUF4870 domain-containing protein [Planctomycetes bacterium]|nr:DUF4870 domain-containing protein [Planctomycetota bacterium]
MTAADTADFSDRPWMHPDTDPVGEEPKAHALDERKLWRAACHGLPVLSYVVPGFGVAALIPLLIWRTKARREGDEELIQEAVEALNFQVNVVVLAFLLTATVIGLPLMVLLLVFAGILGLAAALRVYRGQEHRYRWILRPITVD